MDNNTDQEPHKLVLDSSGGMEPTDWTIVHLPSCPTETYQDQLNEKESHSFVHYICRVQACVDANGIDDIENWKELPDGEYKIKSYYEYWPGEFGGTYGEEHEIGLILDEGSSG